MILYDLCIKYICQKHNVDSIGEIPYGRGYAEAKSEFSEALRKITLLGYGIIFIAHSDYKTEDRPDEEGGSREVVMPLLDKRCYPVINALVDIIGYIGAVEENGVLKRYLFTRSTPNIIAGSRIPSLPSRIPFGYDELIEALGKAFDAQEKEGAKFVDTGVAMDLNYKSFEDLIEEAKALWMLLIDQDEKNLDKMSYIVEKTFGKDFKLSQATERQKDLLEIVVDEFKELKK